MKSQLIPFFLLVFTSVPGFGGLVRQEWIVDGVTREALISVPADAGASRALPLVFVFHGHGGSMGRAARSYPIHELWPEAIVVYPQGLPTRSQLVDPAGRTPGWQGKAGQEGDRDLRFFDVMLASLRAKYQVDNARIYATGHSNGGVFTYLLWAERGEIFAAFAPCAGVLEGGFYKLRPKPILHIGSPQDPIVKFAWQSRMINYVLRLNGCGPRQPDTDGYTSYPSSRGAEVATYLHSGGHVYPDAAQAYAVKFFQAHPKS